jgi:hypothetical protein
VLFEYLPKWQNHHDHQTKEIDLNDNIEKTFIRGRSTKEIDVAFLLASA